MRGKPGPSLALAACLLASASASRAESPAFLSPAAGAPLLSGTTVTVQWSPGAAPDDIREMELVLSLDGGRSFDLRVTGEIEPGVTRVAWRVPEISARNARLALRAGAGSRDSEKIRLVSASFEIRQQAGAPPERVFPVEGEWRTREALDLPESAPVPFGSIEPEGGFFLGDAPEAVGTPSRTDSLETRPETSRGAEVRRAQAPPASSRLPALARLASTPLRE
ncbi:MAG TPA: hypothetical protein VLH41_03445 [Thermoanaerobaculia bacterium]|nr:hypothetical protein [Thermoanaerobaculia bacterium]